MTRSTQLRRTLAALVALFAALPSTAHGQGAPAAPPPPEQLPWAQPADPQQGLLPRKDAPAPQGQPTYTQQQQQVYAAPPAQQQQQQVYAPPPAQPQQQQPVYAPPAQQQPAYAPPPQQQQQVYAAPPPQQQPVYAPPPAQQQPYPQQQAYPPPQPYPAQPQAYPPQQAYPAQPQAYPPPPGSMAPLQAYPLASPPPQARPPQPAYRPDYAYDPRTGTWYLLAPPPPAPPQAYAVPVQQPHPAPAPAAAPPPPVAPAPKPFEPEIEFAIRTGLTTPGGEALPGVDTTRFFGKQFALGLELGVRASPHFHVGLFAEGAGGMAGSDFGGPTGGGTSCGGMACQGDSVSGRVGVQLRYHFLPYHSVDPWIAYGVALSAAAVETPTTQGTSRRTLTGYEHAKISTGLDFKLGHSSALGLFAEWTTGRYTEFEDKLNGNLVSSGSISPTTTHTWFTIGPRIRF